jgi:hypothetical protein
VARTMTAARRGSWSRLANCTLIARKIKTAPERPRPRIGTYVLTWAFVVGAGDGNRTRIISLGICTVHALTWPDLRRGLSVSNRERPPFTGVNGMLMAR